jgi:hypothetical protein
LTVHEVTSFGRPGDELVRIVCLFTGTNTAEEALTRLGICARHFQQATAAEKAKAVDRELLETEMQAVQASCVSSTGHGMSADDARKIALERRAGRNHDVSSHALKDEQTPDRWDDPSNKATRIAAVKTGASAGPVV